MVPSSDVGFPPHLVNNFPCAEEAPMYLTITKKSDVNKVDATDLGHSKASVMYVCCIMAMLLTHIFLFQTTKKR